MYTKTHKLTQNGLFYEAAKQYIVGKRAAEVIHVYEKIQSGLWVYNGEFKLVDAWQEETNHRKVFKFRLQAIDQIFVELSNKLAYELDHTRVIPSKVKVEVWQRDKGKCVNCGSMTNLHFDHMIPFSRGGTSLSAKNIQLLCMTCNLAKRDKIE
jgi:hypothetical protein